MSTFGEAGTLNAPADIIRDGRGNFVVADKENNRIVVLDPQTLHAVKILDGFTGKNGQPDTFNKPQGVFSARAAGSMWRIPITAAWWCSIRTTPT